VLPASIQSRATSCQGLNFHPNNSTTTYDWNNAVGEYLYRTDGGQANDHDGYFLCDPGLPQRAVVTKVQFTLYDNAPHAEIRYCALYRTGLSAATADDAPQLMAVVPSTGMADLPGVVRKTTTSIAHPTIDNANWSYRLQCQINSDPSWASSYAGIYGAATTYRIDAANG
jgi:hypothetical protein